MENTRRPQLRRKIIMGGKLYWLRSNMCIFIHYSLYFPSLGNHVRLKHTLNMFLYVFWSKGSERPQLRRKTITGEQLFWLMSNMWIFSQLFIVISIFRTPCMAKAHFAYCYLCIWIKRLPKCPSSEGKVLGENN